jgi:hypothetical protein
MNPVTQIIQVIHATHPILFWLAAIVGFPNVEIGALLAIAIAAIAIQ